MLLITDMNIQYDANKCEVISLMNTHKYNESIKAHPNIRYAEYGLFILRKHLIDSVTVYRLYTDCIRNSTRTATDGQKQVSRKFTDILSEFVNEIIEDENKLGEYDKFISIYIDTTYLPNLIHSENIHEIYKIMGKIDLFVKYKKVCFYFAFGYNPFNLLPFYSLSHNGYTHYGNKFLPILVVFTNCENCDYDDYFIDSVQFGRSKNINNNKLFNRISVNKLIDIGNCNDNIYYKQTFLYTNELSECISNSSTTIVRHNGSRHDCLCNIINNEIIFISYILQNNKNIENVFIQVPSIYDKYTFKIKCINCNKINEIKKLRINNNNINMNKLIIYNSSKDMILKLPNKLNHNLKNIYLCGYYNFVTLISKHIHNKITKKHDKIIIKKIKPNNFIYLLNNLVCSLNKQIKIIKFIYLFLLYDLSNELIFVIYNYCYGIFQN